MMAKMKRPTDSSRTQVVVPAARPAHRLGESAWRLVANNWKVALYLFLILLCVLFAPEEPLKFIYTEF
jgi:hypothetical protein